MRYLAKTAIVLTILLCAEANAADCSITSTGNVPLYPSIFVPRTAEERSAGLAAVSSIPAGNTVLLSIGMSNAKGIWDHFKSDAELDPLKNPAVQVVNGAQAGGATASWASEGLDKTWGELDESLANVGVAKKDVSVIWFMLANTVKSSSTPDSYTDTLENDTRNALDLFAIEFPNLKVVWLQSMIYAGYSTTSGNHEPYAYQTGVVAQRVSMDQDWPFFVGYGPYLWADGTVPRDDGLTWLCADFKEDGNHPETGAKIKHSDGLLQFFHEDSVASIAYLGAGALLTVPDVVGLDQATAESLIVSSSLVVGTVSTASSSAVAAGRVISQSPTGGASAASGTAVNLIISLGPAQLVTVPDVVGFDQATAELSIVSSNLVVGTVSTANSDTVVAGNVISQSPAGGSSAALGSAVNLVVSLGTATGVPMIISPTVGSILSGSSVTFMWSAEGAVVDTWRLEVGTSLNGRDLFVSGLNATVLSQVVSGLPTDGSLIYVNLKWRVGGVRSTASYVYTAANDGDPPPDGIPAITVPVPGSILSGASETFTWSAGSTAVSRWRLEVGTFAGGTDLSVQSIAGAVTSTTVSGLPTDGSLVYVSLKWRTGSVTSVASYVYTATGGSP